jgi:serine/threonine-protein kinase
MSILKPGELFQGLRVERPAGTGSHGEVYFARSLATGELYALKVIVASPQDHRRVQRNVAAARGVWGIDHPNVVKTFDLGCDADRRVYVVMEPLRGCSIAALLQWGRPSIVFSVSVAIEAARGLGAAHMAGVVHRDVKPSNLFLVNVDARRTAVKVLDFSLAKVFPDGFETTEARRAALGTPAYMAPEHFAGARPHVGLDVYGLGMTLWEALAGRHPWQAERADMKRLVAKQRDEMPPFLSEVAGVPPQVDEVVRCALAKRPEARFRSMAEMAGALADARAWLVREELVGRLVLPVPMGQPPVPGETDPYDASAAHVTAVPSTPKKERMG